MSAGEIRRLWNRSRTLYYMLSIKASRKKPYPFYVNLVVNSSCNLACAYCFGRYSTRKRPHWRFEEMKDLINTLHRRGTRYILVQGGEPLLHPQLGEIIRYIRGKNIIAAILSNGQCPDKIEGLEEIKLLDNICFSLDGNKDGNDKVRGKGSFDKVIESIDAARKAHKTPIRINSTITKYVKDDVDFMAEFIRKNSIEWGINYLFKGDERLGNEEICLTDEEMREYEYKILKYKKKGYPIFTTKKILKYMLDWPVSYRRKYICAEEAKRLLGKKAIECQYGKYEIVIDEDGCVYPCQGMQGIFEAKNLNEVGFDKALEHLSAKPCYTCYLTSLINTSAMINWDFDVILDTVGLTLRNRLFGWRRSR